MIPSRPVSWPLWGVPLVVILVTWTVASVMVPGFMSTEGVSGILGRSVTVGIIAAGFTICLVSGQIDLSVGAVFALSGVLFALLQPTYGAGIAVEVAVGASVMAGLLNSLLVNILLVNSFIASLGTLLLARGMAFVVSGGQPVSADVLDAALWFNRALLGPVSPRVMVLILVTIVLAAYLQRTRWGRETLATGGDPAAALAMGIPTRRRTTVAFVICSSCAGVAGVAGALSLLSGSPIVGDAELLAVVGAVFLGGAALTGGRGSVVASVLAVVGIASVSSALELARVPRAWQAVLIGVVIILAASPYLRGLPQRLRRSSISTTAAQAKG